MGSVIATQNFEGSFAILSALMGKGPEHNCQIS